MKSPIITFLMELVRKMDASLKVTFDFKLVVQFNKGCGWHLKIVFRLHSEKEIIINGIVGKHIKKSDEDMKRPHHFKREKMIMPSFKLGFVNSNFIHQMSGGGATTDFFEAKYVDMFIQTHYYVSKNISRETVPISK